MLNKYLLPGCLIAALTACGGGQDLDYGPINPSIPDDPPAAPEYTPQWRFTDESDVGAWTVEWSKAEASEIEWHSTQYALEIHPNWGGEDVNAYDSITVYGTLDEPIDLSFGTVYLSLYYTRENLGNPWGTGPYWGQAAHHIGTQYLVIDADGNRAFLDTGNGSNWMNSFDIGNASNDFIRSDPDARGNQSIGTIDQLAQGYWFDLALKVGDERGLTEQVHYFPDGDNAGTFDMTSVVSFGVKMHYAMDFASRNDDSIGYPDAAGYWTQFGGASDRYFYLDEIALVPGEPPPPVPVEPPPASTEIPEFGFPVYLDSLESGFNSSWPNVAAIADYASSYGAKSGTSSIKVEFDAAGSQILIGGPDETLDLSTVTTFDFSVWVESGSGPTKLWVSMCDCDDGIEVSLVEEEWNNISIDVADFEKDFLYGAIGFKNNSNGSRTIYIDEVGFDKVRRAAPRFEVPVYLDGVQPGFSDGWGGWNGTWTWDSNEVVRDGSTSLKLEYAANGGGSLQIGANSLDLTALRTFHFSAYYDAPEGTDPLTLRVAMCDCDTGYVFVDLEPGVWSTHTVDIDDFQQTTLTGAIRVRALDGNVASTVFLDNIGFNRIYEEPRFDVPVYYDSVQAGFSDQWGGWNGTWTWDSNEVVQDGEASIKLEYSANGGGSLQIGSSSLDLTTLSTFHFSAYGAPGTGTTTVRVAMCDCDTGYVMVDVEEGVWTNYTIDVADFMQTTLTGAIRIRALDGNAAATIYVDNIGFDLQLPPVPYDVPVYMDGIQEGFSDQWGGWNGTWTWDSIEQVYFPDTAVVDDTATSIKIEYSANGGGSLQIGANSLDLTTLSTFNFAAYGAEGSGTTTVRIAMCDCDTGYVFVDVLEGVWTYYSIDVADFGQTTLTGAIRIRALDGNDAATIYVDSIGFNE